jgi:hypothetical protein
VGSLFESKSESGAKGVMNAILFVLMNISAVWTSIVLVQAFFRDEARGPRILIALVLFPVLVLLTLLALGLAHMLSALAALIVVSVVGAVVYVSRVREFSNKLDPQFEVPGKEAVHGLVGNLQGRFALALLLFAAAPTIVRAVFLGPHFSVDDLWYHAPYVTWWMQLGGFTYEHAHQLTSYYPFNAELFALWFVLPFGRDAFATLAGAYWGILLGVSLVLLLLTIGRSLTQALLLPALVITLPIVPISLLRYAAVDLGGVAAVIAATALVLSCKPTPRIWLVAGLISGFAVGSKLTFLPGSVVLGLWIVLGPAPGAGAAVRLKRAFYHLAGLIVTGSFWYLNNWWLTGNPTFPAQVGPFPGPIPGEYFNTTSLAGWLAATNLDGATIQELVRSHIDWPWPQFMAGVVGVVACVVLLVMRKLSLHERHLGLFAILMMGVSLISFVYMPSSKPSDMGGGVLEAKHRFLILSGTLALICLAMTLTRSKRGWHLYLLVTSICVLLVWPGSLMMALGTAIPLAVLLLGWKWLYRIGQQLQIRRYAFLLFGLVLCGLAIWQPVAQRRTDERLFTEGYGADPAWEELGKLPAGAQIASVGPSSENIYPLFGRDLSLHPVVIGWGGNPREPVHEVWKKDPDKIEWREGGAAGNIESFVLNMRRAGVSYVYLSRLEDGQWPPHLDQLKALGDSCLVYRDEKAQIWKLPG